MQFLIFPLDPKLFYLFNLTDDVHTKSGVNETIFGKLIAATLRNLWYDLKMFYIALQYCTSLFFPFYMIYLSFIPERKINP